MSGDGEWGPWIWHDGGPRPVPRGTFCHLVWEDGFEFIGHVGVESGDITVGPDDEPWGGAFLIIRYRIRKPRALLDLIDLVENLPAPARQPEKVAP